MMSDDEYKEKYLMDDDLGEVEITLEPSALNVETYIKFNLNQIFEYVTEEDLYFLLLIIKDKELTWREKRHQVTIWVAETMGYVFEEGNTDIEDQIKSGTKAIIAHKKKMIEVTKIENEMKKEEKSENTTRDN